MGFRSWLDTLTEATIDRLCDAHGMLHETILYSGSVTWDTLSKRFPLGAKHLLAGTAPRMIDRYVNEMIDNPKGGKLDVNARDVQKYIKDVTNIARKHFNKPLSGDMAQKKWRDLIAGRIISAPTSKIESLAALLFVLPDQAARMKVKPSEDSADKQKPAKRDSKVTFIVPNRFIIARIKDDVQFKKFDRAYRATGDVRFPNENQQQELATKFGPGNYVAILGKRLLKMVPDVEDKILMNPKSKAVNVKDRATNVPLIILRDLIKPQEKSKFTRAA